MQLPSKALISFGGNFVLPVVVIETSARSGIYIIYE